MKRDCIKLVPLLISIGLGAVTFSAPAATNLVKMGNYWFSPTNLAINPGDTVVWTNTSLTAHDSSSSNLLASWGSPALAQRQTWGFRFTNAGYYPYFCALHVAAYPQQTGSVTVVSAGNVAPSVAITNPADGAVLTDPASFTLQATASDSDGIVAQVEFFNGASSLGTDSTSPYSVAVNNLGAGIYTLSAVAADNVGAKATNTVTVTVNDPPTASISSPTDGQSFTAPANITLTAIANDTDGTISQVEFFSGATSLGTDTTSPYSVSWNSVSAGSYMLTVKATDNRGAVTTSSAVTITVGNNAAPTVTVTSPADNTVLTAPASFTFAATANDTDGTVEQVEFFNGGSSLGADSTNPYSVAVNNLPAGIYTLSAVATDNAGATATNSVSLIVNSPPTASISSPTNGQSFAAPAKITIQASASDDDGTVTNVEFFAGATKLGEDASSPYRFSWNSVGAGNYDLTVRATDNRGVTAISALVAISVINSSTAPVTLLAPAMSGTDFSFSFATQSGVLYDVQYTDALGSGNWQSFQTVTGDGSTLSVTNNTAGATQRFFRVQAQ